MKLWKFGQNAYVVAKAVAKGLVNGINEGIDKVETIRKDAKATDEETVINVQLAKELKWMNPDQLRAIFAGKKVRMSNEPDAWRQLKWLNSDQLEAIFGKDGPKV